MTPQFKIEDEYWYVSYDNGANWTMLGKATGEDGKDGGDSIFKSVTQDSSNVYFTLSDGTTITIPKVAGASALNITFDVEQGVAIVPGSTIKVGYTITGGDENNLVRLVVYGDYDISGIVKPTTANSGYIYVFLEEWFEGDDDPERDEPWWEEGYGDDVTNEDAYNTHMVVVVSVSDGSGNSILKSLNITEGKISSVSDAYLADAAAGTVTAQVNTNVSYDVVIPETASWLTYAPTKATTRTDNVTFNVAANTGDKFRSTVVELKNDMGQVLESFTIVQRSSIAGQEIALADASVKAACVTAFDTDLDGRLTYEEAANVKSIEALKMPVEATSFDELQYFASIKEIPEYAFSGCSAMASVVLPDQIISIKEGAFSGCSSLKAINLPDGLKRIGNSAFVGCSSLASIDLPASLEYLGVYRTFDGCSSLSGIALPEIIDAIGSRMFADCESLEEITLPATIREIGSEAFKNTALKTFAWPENITYIPDGCFDGSRYFTVFTIPSYVTSIGSCAFRNTLLGYGAEEIDINGEKVSAYVIPENIEWIGYEAFYGCEQLGAVYFEATEPCDCGYDAFSYETVIYVPEGCYDAYRDSWGEDYNWAFKPSEEVQYLRELYDSTNGDTWNDKTNWFSNKPLNEWYGIKTDEQGSIVELNLEGNNLSGNLWLDLNKFPNLQQLNINNNELSVVDLQTNNVISDLELDNCASEGINVYDFSNVKISNCDSLCWIGGSCDTLNVSNCVFRHDESTPFGINARVGHIYNCYMHSCGLHSDYLRFEESTTYNTWHCVTTNSSLIFPGPKRLWQ